MRDCSSAPRICDWCKVRLEHDGTRAETRFGLSAIRTSSFKSAGASVQSTTGSRGVRISVSNAGYTRFRGSMRVLATHSIRQFSLHSPPCVNVCRQVSNALCIGYNSYTYNSPTPMHEVYEGQSCTPG